MEQEKNKAFRFMPRCNESSAFFLVIVFLLSVIAVNPRNLLAASIKYPALGIFVLGLVLGSFFVVYYFLFKRTKSTIRAQHFVTYIILMLTVIGIFSGAYSILHVKYIWMIVFPLINIFQSVRMFNLMSMKNKMHDKLYLLFYDDKSRQGMVVAGSLIVAAIFVFMNVLLHVYWAVAASVCAIYIFSIHGFAENVIQRMAARQQA